MKKFIFIFALVTISMVGFSQRVLTDVERQSLLNHPTFQMHCEFAVRNYADYWSIHDGAGLSTEAARIKWAKDRILSVKIITVDIGDASLALKFVKLSKGMQFSLGAAPQNADTIISEFLSGNKFEELASSYFTLLGDDINLSIGN